MKSSLLNDQRNQSKASANNLSDNKLNPSTASSFPAVTQMVRDGFYGPAPSADEVIPRERIIFTAAFQTKHFADNAANAEQKTRNRVNGAACPAGILNGTIPNTTATAANWKDAVFNSATVVPDVPNWQGGIGISLNGWQTTYTPPVAPAPAGTYATAALAAGAINVGGVLEEQGGNLKIDHVG